MPFGIVTVPLYIDRIVTVPLYITRIAAVLVGYTSKPHCHSAAIEYTEKRPRCNSLRARTLYIIYNKRLQDCW